MEKTKMAVVNTNISASLSQAALAKNDRALSKAMEQLSTGKKINSAADDAAGLAISTRMTSQIIGLEQSIQNANDAISMVNTAEGALDEVTNLLQRMRELALQAANGTTDTADRSYLNKEYQNLYAEIDRIADNTEWNGRNILNNQANGNGSSLVEFQVGMNAGQTISVDFGNFTNVSGSGTFADFVSAGATAGTISANSTTVAQTNASAALSSIDTALTAISNQRATFGAVSNQLIHAVDNLTNVVTNSEASRSRMMDTDYAASTSELARTQIIQQASTAMLAQANQLPQSVLQLLQN
ncbi:flagellin [Luminiphilus sp.]|nr:flagellin [Luminiphilus sp.]MDA9721700.1 flagellin [Luminiphilus sp.]